MTLCLKDNKASTIISDTDRSIVTNSSEDIGVPKILRKMTARKKNKVTRQQVETDYIGVEK